MALDGLAISTIVHELNNTIIGSRIDKIHQPEKDEITIGIRGFGQNHKLLMTINPQSPRICFTTTAKKNPTTPPLFTMILRKHLQGGKVLSVEQPDFERIVKISIESLNEFGELEIKHLIIEIMGKHSNIILLNNENKVIDSIIRVSFDKSRVRQVLPNLLYTKPANNKYNPLTLKLEQLSDIFNTTEQTSVQKALYQNITGISPILASEIVHLSNLDDNIISVKNNKKNTIAIYNKFKMFMDIVQNGSYSSILFVDKDNIPKDFSVYPISIYQDYKAIYYNSISELLEQFYTKKDKLNRINQKTSDLRKLLQNDIDRTNKKISIQEDTIKKAKNKDKYKLYGELITANIYTIKKGDEKLTTHNYYSEDNEEITINIDKNKTPQENAQKYFKKYNKLKRGELASIEQLEINNKELKYLVTVLSSLHTVETEEDIAEIRTELYHTGYLRKPKNQGKKIKEKKSKPLLYISSDGYEMYVGKNNTQNDYLTTKFAEKLDIWCHIKDDAGSHVIIRNKGTIIPDNTIYEACMLAGYYSKSKDGSLVPIDYTEVKYVKKPNGSKPGMVIYTTNKTAYITPSEEFVTSLSQNKI